MMTASLAALAVLAAPQTTQQLNTHAVPYQAQPYQAATPLGTYQPRVLNDQDTALFRQGLAQARALDVIGTQNTIRQIGDPTARKLVEWALVDTSAQQLSYYELAEDQRTLNGWPRADSRRQAGEQALDRAGLGANDVLAFFGDTAPETVEGAIAKAGALEQSGRQAEARAEKAAQSLIARAESGQDVLVLAHGYFNHMVGRRLRADGWALVHNQGFKYWSQRRYEKR